MAHTDRLSLTQVIIRLKSAVMARHVFSGKDLDYSFVIALAPLSTEARDENKYTTYSTMLLNRSD